MHCASNSISAPVDCSWLAATGFAFRSCIDWKFTDDSTSSGQGAPVGRSVSEQADDGGLHAVTANESTGEETVRSAVVGNTYTRQQVGLGAAEPGSETPADSAIKRKSYSDGNAPRYWAPRICSKCRQHGHDSSCCPQNAPVCDMCGSPGHTDALTCPGRQLLQRAVERDNLYGAPGSMIQPAQTTTAELQIRRQICGASCSSANDNSLGG